jgi:hypothetical protein
MDFACSRLALCQQDGRYRIDNRSFAPLGRTTSSVQPAVREGRTWRSRENKLNHAREEPGRRPSGGASLEKIG